MLTYGAIYNTTQLADSELIYANFLIQLFRYAPISFPTVCINSN